MSAVVLTTRLPQWLGEELKEEFAKFNAGPSEGLRRVVEQWWVGNNLPALEYRDSLDGPRPAIKNGPELWSFIMTHRSYEGDLDGVSEHYGGLPADGMEQALVYYQLFSDAIDHHLAENERLWRLYLEQNE
jgi:hypothetical protein